MKKMSRFKDNILIKLRSGIVYDTITWIVQLFIMALTVYMVVLYTAVGMIPYLGGVFVQAMGITADTQIMDLFILWMVPCGFVILMIFAGELLLFYFLWKLLKKVFNKLRAKRHKELAEKYDNKK